MRDVHFTVENWFLKCCFWYTCSKQIFQWLPGDSDALLSGRPSWLRVSPASILPSIPEFSDDDKIWLSGNYTFEVIPLLLNGSTVQCTWYWYCSLKFEELICFLHHVMILLFSTTEFSFRARPMCSRHQQCDIWTYFIGRHVSTGSRGNFLVLKLTLLHTKEYRLELDQYFHCSINVAASLVNCWCPGFGSC